MRMQKKTIFNFSHWGCPDHWIRNPVISKKCKYDVSFVGKSLF